MENKKIALTKEEKTFVKKNIENIKQMLASKNEAEMYKGSLQSIILYTERFIEGKEFTEDEKNESTYIFLPKYLVEILMDIRDNKLEISNKDKAAIIVCSLLYDDYYIFMPQNIAFACKTFANSEDEDVFETLYSKACQASAWYEKSKEEKGC